MTTSEMKRKYWQGLYRTRTLLDQSEEQTLTKGRIEKIRSSHKEEIEPLFRELDEFIQKLKQKQEIY